MARPGLTTTQVAEAVIAALNAGVCGLGYWAFADLPDEYSATCQNNWGALKWSGQDRAPTANPFGGLPGRDALATPAAGRRLTG